ncbi:MAG: hypothetical protein EOP52_04215 [Sphingobacteriales bacterium]|nr:MAG: hypothetical protein EOP52_04215 [Sphingobacteriales bacterium]
MSDRNRLYTILFFVTVLILGTYLIVELFQMPELIWLGLAANGIYLVWFFILWRQSRFRKSPYKAGWYLGISALLVGTLSRIQHWSFASIWLTTGCLLLLGSYVLWYLRNPVKTTFDHLKMIWLGSFLLAKWALWYRFFPESYLLLLYGNLLFMLVLFYFIRQQRAHAADLNAQQNTAPHLS